MGFLCFFEICILTAVYTVCEKCEKYFYQKHEILYKKTFTISRDTAPEAHFFDFVKKVTMRQNTRNQIIQQVTI